MVMKIVVIAAIVVVLLGILTWYGKHADLKKPLMKESCHGSCADCAVNCKGRKK